MRKQFRFAGYTARGAAPLRHFHFWLPEEVASSFTVRVYFRKIFSLKSHRRKACSIIWSWRVLAHDPYFLPEIRSPNSASPAPSATGAPPLQKKYFIRPVKPFRISRRVSGFFVFCI